MTINTYKKNGYHVLALKDKLTLGSDLSELKPVVRECLAQGAKRIAVSFPPKSIINSASIAVLVDCLGMIMKQKGKMAIIRPCQDVVDTLTIIGSFKLVKIYPSEDDLGKKAPAKD